MVKGIVSDALWSYGSLVPLVGALVALLEHNHEAGQIALVLLLWLPMALVLRWLDGPR